MKAILFLSAAIILSACAQPRMITPPTDGYRAMRVDAPIRTRVVNHRYPYAIGSVFVQDRVRPDGLPLWCQGVGEARHCFALRDGQILPFADGLHLGTELWSPVPPGALTEIRMR